MQIKIDLKPELPGIQIHLNGTYNMLGMKKLIDDLARRIRRDKPDGDVPVFIDTRDVKGEVSTLDRYALGVYYTNHLHGIRLALLTTEKYYNDEHFFENVVTNRGGTIKAFVDEAAAKDWLGWESATNLA